MSDSLTCCKYLMFFFNLLIFLSGAALLGVGIWVAVGADSFKQVVSQDPAIFNAVYIIIAVGALLFLVGFLGCCGAIKENKFMLGAFFVMVLIIFILEIIGGVLAFVYYPKAKQAAIDSMKLYDDATPEGNTVKAAWDAFQTAFKCCGINTPADWPAQTVTVIPTSCLGFTQGCENALKGYFWALGGVAIGVLFIELLAMIFACCLYRGVNKHQYA
ncbi:tetraspanin-18B [Ciona intestinalis]